MGRARPKQRQKLLKIRLKKGTLEKLHKCLIYRKLVCCQVRGLRSIAGHAFDCTDVCSRSYLLRSNARNCHGAKLEAMEARAG